MQNRFTFLLSFLLPFPPSSFLPLLPFLLLPSFLSFCLPFFLSFLSKKNLSFFFRPLSQNCTLGWGGGGKLQITISAWKTDLHSFFPLFFLSFLLSSPPSSFLSVLPFFLLLSFPSSCLPSFSLLFQKTCDFSSGHFPKIVLWGGGRGVNYKS